jgi:hypothetical protein
MSRAGTRKNRDPGLQSPRRWLSSKVTASLVTLLLTRRVSAPSARW